MFCPSCSQAFHARGAHECPNCNFKLGGNYAPVKNATGFTPTAVDRVTALEHPRVEAGVRKGLNLLFIAAGFFPVYTILGSLYPTDPGQRSSELFNTGGKAILLTLAVAGLARVAYALIFERRAALREEQGI
jgi:hypothetical protein